MLPLSLGLKVLGTCSLTSIYEQICHFTVKLLETYYNLLIMHLFSGKSQDHFCSMFGDYGISDVMEIMRYESRYYVYRHITKLCFSCSVISFNKRHGEVKTLARDFLRVERIQEIWNFSLNLVIYLHTQYSLHSLPGGLAHPARASHLYTAEVCCKELYCAIYQYIYQHIIICQY